MENFGILSLAPAVVAVALAFITRDALISLLIGIAVGIFVTGGNVLTGFVSLCERALGNADFIWIMLIEVFIGIMVAYFQKSGAIDAFTNSISKFNLKRRGVQIVAWLLGVFIFFSDYFSILFVGNVMRGVTDKAKVSREKLAYICDSTAAPKGTMIPFGAWGVYMAGLLVGIGSIADIDIAQNVVFHMVAYNFYGILAIAMVGLFAIGIIPDYGPMRRAEDRAFKEGKVIADGATPMLSNELDNIKPNNGVKSSLFIDFIFPVLLIIGITIGTYAATGSAKILESFVCAVAFQFVVMIVRKMATVAELISVATEGIKSVISAILILAMAHCLNELSKELGTANYVISVTRNWVTPTIIIVLTFSICAFIGFFTGSSWGTYAIVTPICMPLAFELTGGAITPLIYAAVAAIMGGGCFGDHCSPLSDTTILSSLAAGSDHIDHVKTQIPYAISAAAISAVGYIIVGLTA